MLGLIFKIILFILNIFIYLVWVDYKVHYFYILYFDLSMWTNIKSSLKFEGLFQQLRYEMDLCAGP